MRRKRGEAFDFVPRFFVLPRDYDELQQDLDRFPGRMYIQKVWGRMYIHQGGVWGGYTHRRCRAGVHANLNPKP